MATTKKQVKTTPKSKPKQAAKPKASIKARISPVKKTTSKAKTVTKKTAPKKAAAKSKVIATAKSKTPVKEASKQVGKSKSNPKTTWKPKRKPTKKSIPVKSPTKSKSKTRTKAVAKSTGKPRSAVRSKSAAHKTNPKKSKRSLYILVLVGLMMLLVIGSAIAGVAIHKNRKNAKENKEREAVLKAGPLVKVTQAKYNDGGGEIVLIAEARPFRTATLYAKISGYLQSINVDKGDNVISDQLLAVVDNPEIDQQYKGALTDMVNKKKIAERDTALVHDKFIPQEEADISQTNLDVARANVTSLAEQQQYKMIRAPFSGTITARYVDPGALIQNAINSQTSSQPIVTIEDLDKLRIYAYVEQRDAAFLSRGDSVDITIPEKPKMHLRSTITRISGDLDAHTRMMLTEVDVDNPKQELVPGSYIQLHFRLPKNAQNRKIVVPTEALVIHQTKTMVATIDKDSTLHFKPVKVGDNTGEQVTILDGLQEGDRVALSVGENFAEGKKVRISK